LLRVGGATHVARPSIRALEARLDARQFVRINRSVIVNLDHARVLDRRAISNRALIRDDRTVLEISRRRRAAVARSSVSAADHHRSHPTGIAGRIDKPRRGRHTRLIT
jgi:hypothetical protein